MQDQKKLNFLSNFTKIRTNFKRENKKYFLGAGIQDCWRTKILSPPLPPPPSLPPPLPPSLPLFANNGIAQVISPQNDFRSLASVARFMSNNGTSDGAWCVPGVLW